MDKFDNIKKAAIEKNSNLFMNSIYVLSEDDIIKFTDEQFNNILEYCSDVRISSGEFFKSIFEKGVYAMNNSKIQIDKEQENLIVGKFYFSILLKLYQIRDQDFAIALLDLGTIYEDLSEFELDPRNYIERSIRLQQEARNIFPKESLYYAGSIMNEGNAHVSLAKFGVNPTNNLKKAIILLKEAMALFSKNKNTIEYASALLNLGIAHIKLVELTYQTADIKLYIELAIKLEREVMTIIPKNNPKNNRSYALAAMHLGTAYLKRAEIPVSMMGYKVDLEDCVKELEDIQESIRLEKEATDIFPKNSLDSARAAMIQGAAYSTLAGFGIDIEDNIRNAENLFEISKDIFLNNKNLDYSLAILNWYDMYRRIFLRYGNKICLKNAKDLLEDSKKIIERWELPQKQEILGMLSSVEADLYELNENYFRAGMKYCDAYRLTGKIYYKFMYEFCEAKSSKDIKKKYFCELIERWREYDKKGIFLDFYDCAIFECYLEEALEDDALRFDKINDAKSKLDEIYTRTEIQHIKIRVGAYIDILNAYLYFFPEKDDQREDEKAKENISNACRVFKNQGYRHEIELCNLLIRAIKNKDQQKVWLDLFKNNLSNNLSQLVEEAANNEIIKLQTLGVKKDLIEIKGGLTKLTQKLDEYFIEINKKGPRQEIVISTGIDIYGTAYKLVTTIPLQKIVHYDLEEDLGKVIGRMRLSEIPGRLKNIIMKFLDANNYSEK